MLTRNKIVELIAKDKSYIEMCKKICDNNTTDLWQDTMLTLLEQPEEKIVSMYKKNQLKFFVCKILMNQAHSNTSYHYKNYVRRETFYTSDITHEPYDYETDTLIHKMLTEITLYASQSDDNWYRAELFKLYINEGSIRKLAKKTGIPPMSICRSLEVFKQQIKSLINENTTNHKRKANWHKLLEATNATRLFENGKQRS